MKLRGIYKVNSDDDRIKIIAQLIEEGMVDPVVRKTVLEIVKDCKSKDWKCEINKIYKWVKENIKYRYDPIGIDAYHSARRILETRSADCDDYAILAGAMFASLGYPIILRIVAKTKDRKYHHIYPVIGVPPHKSLKDVKKWIPLEFTVPQINKPGVEVPYAKKKDYYIQFTGEAAKDKFETDGYNNYDLEDEIIDGGYYELYPEE